MGTSTKDQSAQDKTHSVNILHASVIGGRRGGLPGLVLTPIHSQKGRSKNAAFQAAHNTFHQTEAVVHNYGLLLFWLSKAPCQTLEPLLLNFSWLTSTPQVIIRPLARGLAGHEVPVCALLTMVTNQHLHGVPGARRKGTLCNLHSSTGQTALMTCTTAVGVLRQGVWSSDVNSEAHILDSAENTAR